MIREKQPRITKKTLLWLWGISLAVLFMVGMISLVLLMAISPKKEEMMRAEGIVRHQSGMTNIRDTNIYNGDKTWYSAIGTGDDNKDYLVLISSDGKEILKAPLSSGISQKRAKEAAQKKGAKTIDRVVAGVYKGNLIWEVKGGENYYLISFKTGECLQIL